MSRILDEIFLFELISCPKIIIRVDRKSMVSKNRSQRNNANLMSTCERFLFEMFLRRSDEFYEDFSIGLVWKNAMEYTGINKDITLLRVQGPHDSKVPEGKDLHHDFHIHQITPQDIQEKRYKKPAHKATCGSYKSFEQAAWHFTELCGITNPGDSLGFPFDGPNSRDQLSIDDFLTP